MARTLEKHVLSIDSAENTSPIMLTSLQLRNFLSFGPASPDFTLRPLNLLLGPNGSGKSNVIEAICLLRASASDMGNVVRKGGGTPEWVWKGAPNHPATVSAGMAYKKGFPGLRHRLEFMPVNQRFHLVDEQIENERPDAGKEQPFFYYRYYNGKPVVSVRGKERKLTRETVQADASILAQRKDPEQYPEITFLAEQYNRIRVYREWAFGRNTVFREPQRADMRNDQLEEDFSNLGLFLNRMERNPNVKRSIISHLNDIYEGFDDFSIIIEGGTVQVFFTEGSFSIPATRLSDGTLRFLCLLAILCDPSPPPLVCIEEPELGLHPDILPKVADLLIAASQRTQLIVTTHSDILVDCMTEQPETVVVCEKHNGQTEMKRLFTNELGTWLDKYRLGQLWTRGDIGGTRW